MMRSGRVMVSKMGLMKKCNNPKMAPSSMNICHCALSGAPNMVELGNTAINTFGISNDATKRPRVAEIIEESNRFMIGVW